MSTVLKCKTSLMLDCAMLDRINAFAGAQKQNTSEAIRFILECGLETLSRAGFDVKPLPLGHGATRGVFPAPKRSSTDGNPS